MRKFVIAIDLDGVIWDLVTPWLAKYNSITNENVKVEDIKTYNISEYIEHEGILHYILETESFWDSVNLYPGVAEAIRLLKECPDIDLVICSATCYKIAGHKIRRLMQLLPDIDSDDLVLTSRKDLLDAHFMIDDYEDNLKHMAVTGKGVPILINQPYNKYFPNKTYGILRKGSLLEAAQTIINFINSKDDVVSKLS